MLGLVGVVTGAWLSAISILLLLDAVRHRIWGLLAAVSYTIVFPAVFFFSWLLANSQFGTLTSLAAWPALITPLVGLGGGVWGFLWKPATGPVTPEAVEAPRPSRLPKDKPVIPALLSIAGTSPLAFLLSLFVAALFAPPQPPQEGSVGPNIGFLLLPLLVGGAAFLVLLPTIFSIFLLFEPRHHRRWGAVLTAWWGIASAYVSVALVSSFVNLVNGTSTGSLNPSWYTALFFTPFLGLAGGVWGFYWHTGVNPRAWTTHTIARTIRGMSGRVAIGGLASLVSSLFASPVLAILPFFLVIGNMQFGRSGVTSRGRGLALMGLVVVSGLFLSAFEVVEYLNAWWEYGPRVAGLASLTATFLAGSGLVWSIRGPSRPT